MASSSPPPLPPPSPCLDDLMIVPPIQVPPVPVESCNVIIPDDTSLDIFPPIDTSLPLGCTFGCVPPSPPMPVQVQLGSYKPYYDNARGRSGSRSRSRSRSRTPSSANRGRSASPGRYLPVPMPPIYPPTEYRAYSPDSFRSPSPRPTRRRRYPYYSRTPSPMQPYILPPPPPPAPPIVTYVPSCMSSPPVPVPPFPWPQSAGTLLPDPVDILTFQYNKNMAYAPASKTYDEAIDNILELWPDLREFGRDRVHLYVGGTDQMVRIPRMAWQLIMRDFRRYEIVHIQVDQPPQYQGDGKGNWDDKKNKRKGGFFSSIKRVFWR